MAFIANIPQATAGPTNIPSAVPIAGVYVGQNPDSYLQFYSPGDNHVSYAATQLGVGTFVVQPVTIPHIANFTAVDIFLSNSYSATNAGSSMAHTLSFSLGVYTFTPGATNVLSLATSVSVSTAFTVTGSTSSVSYQNLKNFPIPINLPLSPGNYWLAFASSTAAAGNAIAGGFSNVVYSWAGNQSAYAGQFGQSTAISGQSQFGQGILSVTSASVPASFGFSDIQGTGLGNTANPVINLKGISA